MEQTTTTILHFKGRLTFEKIGILLNELKNKKVAFDIHPVIYKKLLTLMIEALENVLKYSDHFEDFIKDHPEFSPEFSINLTDTGFLLICRNPLLDKDKEALSAKIDKLNSSNDEELKAIYKETITNGMFSDKGGAGLGLIDIAKISQQGIIYNFLPAIDKYVIYELILNINHIENLNYE